MPLELANRNLMTVFRRPNVCPLIPPRGDITVGTVLTQYNVPNPPRTAVTQIARNELDVAQLDIQSTLLGDTQIVWRQQDDVSLEAMLGTELAKQVRAQIRTAAQHRKVLNVKLSLKDVVLYTTDVVATINAIEDLEIKPTSFMDRRFYFVESTLTSRGLQIEVVLARADAESIEAEGQKFVASAEVSAKLAVGSERAALLTHDFKAPLTVFCSALELKREGLGRKWKVQKKDKYLALGSSDGERAAQACDWLDAPEGLAIDDVGGDAAAAS